MERKRSSDHSRRCHPAAPLLPLELVVSLPLTTNEFLVTLPHGDSEAIHATTAVHTRSLHEVARGHAERGDTLTALNSLSLFGRNRCCRNAMP